MSEHTAPTCHIHPDVILLCPACMGEQGGKASSDRKTRAARRNAKRKRPNRQPPPWVAKTSSDSDK